MKLTIEFTEKDIGDVTKKDILETLDKIKAMLEAI
jgi:hypothetical protein